MSSTNQSKLPPLTILPGWIVLGIFFGISMLMMFILSFGKVDDITRQIAPIDDLKTYIQSGEAFHNYRDTYQPDPDMLDPTSPYPRIFWKSTWLAIITTVLCLLISYPMAYYIAIMVDARWKNLLLALVAIPFWTSFLIRTYAWRIILQSDGLLNTVLLKLHIIHEPLQLLGGNADFAVLLGLVYGELPFMILPLYASLEKLDQTLLEAASDLGAGAFSRFWRITVPLTMPGILAGTVLVFIPSIGQYVVTDVLGEGKYMLIGNVIQQQFSSAGSKPFGAALSFELSAIVLFLLMAYALYNRATKQEPML